MSAEPAVFIVDDDPVIRDLLSRLSVQAGYQAKVYGSADAFLRGYDPSIPGCLVLDLRMPGTNGLELQTELVERGWRIPIVFLSGFATVDTTAQAMKAEAVYFLEKPVDPDELLDRIREAVAVDRDTRARSARHSQIQARLEQLTPRERGVLRLVVQGKTSRQIAAELHRSIKTIEVHRAHIMSKLNAHGVAELVQMVLSLPNGNFTQ